MNVKNVKNNVVLYSAAILAVFSILFFFASPEVVVADSYDTSGRPLSYYGMTAGSALHGASAVPVGEAGPSASQFYNGVYAGNPVYYSGTTYLGTTYTGNAYSGSSYSGGLVSANGATYSGSSYSGSSADGSAYLGSFYNGLQMAAGAAYAGITAGGGTSPAAAVAYAKCEPYLKSYIGCGYGNSAAEIIKLQKFLNNYEGEKLSISGVYDQPTQNAVRRFQQKYSTDVLKESWGISCATGCVYITTLAKINDIVCNIKTNFKTIPLPSPRPNFTCSGSINPETGKLVPGQCATTAASGGTKGAAAATSTASNISNPNNQAAGVGYIGYMKNKVKNFFGF
jgi:hypothetical protein